MLQLQRSLWSWKTAVCACLLLGVVMVAISGVRFMYCEDCYLTWSPKVQPPTVTRDYVNNSGAVAYLDKYKAKFHSPTQQLAATVDPNNPETVTTWWQAAAMIDCTMLQLQRSLWSWKTAVCACLLLGVVMVAISGVRFMYCEDCYLTWSPKVQPPTVTRDYVNNSGAVAYLDKYKAKFHSPTQQLAATVDPNNPETVTTWWQAAAMIDWYINTPLRYQCRQRLTAGNWHICQDTPFTVKPPCLVYSFGINFDFSFDDAMAQLGCEVHSFDPSMKLQDHKRGPLSTFYNMGLGSYSTDAYVPRADMYVKNNQTWKMRTVKSIIQALGHEDRVIDVFKMDVEGYEWSVLSNMMETGVFDNIRQYMLEFHLFPDFPLKQDYVFIYKVYTKLRELGFREFTIGPHVKTLQVNNFNNQGDVEFVNAFFTNKEKGR